MSTLKERSVARVSAQEAPEIACRTCGYDLTGIGSGPCPECGDAEPRSTALGKATAHGATWVMTTAILGKLATSVAHVLLGWILLPEHFGIFAGAVSIAGLLNLLRDGGTNFILTQQGMKRYERVAGALFWMGFVFSVLSSLLLLAAAWPLAMYAFEKPTPEAFWIIAIVAISNPINVVGAQLQTKLRISLRFAEASRLVLTSSVLRQISTVAFALLGCGALSFAYPFIICAVYETIWGYRATREPVWSRPPEFHLWRGLMRQSLWALAGSSTNYLLDSGPNIVAMRLVDAATLGEFYFAFQITAQLGVLLGFAVQIVLFPILARLNEEPARQAAAIVRSLHAIMLAGAGASLALVVAMEPLQRIIWPGKWEQAVIAVMVLGVFYPWRISFGLTTAVLHARGRFKRHALLTLFEGGGLMVATGIACVVAPNPVGLAWFTGVWLFIARACVTFYILRMQDVPRVSIVEAIFPAWIIGGVAAGAALSLDHFLRIASPVSQRLLPLLQSWSGDAKPELLHRIADASGEGVRLVALLLAFTLVFAGLVRALLARHVQDALALAPRRVQVPVAFALGIKMT